MHPSLTMLIADLDPRARRDVRICGRLTRRHILMLALALEVFGAGVSNAMRYTPPGIVVDEPSLPSHAIT